MYNMELKRELSRAKWEDIWTYFEQRLANEKVEIFLVAEDDNCKQVYNFIKGKVELLYIVSPLYAEYSYELSSKYFEEMHSFNDCYWMDKKPYMVFLCRRKWISQMLWGCV
jgi:hypothetical protein